MDDTNIAHIALTLKWQSEVASHSDRLYVDSNMRELDRLPQLLPTFDAARSAGACHQHLFHPGELLDAYDDKKVIPLEAERFVRRQGRLQVTPRGGRFYPRGFAELPPDCDVGQADAFRIVGIDDEFISIDFNHPLAAYSLALEATLLDSVRSGTSPSITSANIMQGVTANGPGMQAPARDIATDFYSTYPFQRSNNDDDAEFYHTPRLIQHLDDAALQQVTSIYCRLVQGGDRVLDLMSGYLSHLPEVAETQVTGLGMNDKEMGANRQLDEHVVHDLNRQPELPFVDDHFDVVVCTSSIEYLQDPLAVLQQVARVLKSGGLLVAVISDRWFPGKEIMGWAEMHPFERQGLVLDLFVRSGRFDDLHTESIRGLPRPRHDRHSCRLKHSDPIFAVWGRKVPV